MHEGDGCFAWVLLFIGFYETKASCIAGPPWQGVITAKEPPGMVIGGGVKFWLGQGEKLRSAVAWEGVAPRMVYPQKFHGKMVSKPLGDVLPGMNAGASPYAVPSPIEGSGTA